VNPTPSGTYTEWWWPPTPDGYRSFEHVLVPEIDPGADTTYFWAHQFRLVGGEGGYIGLQTKGNRADGSLGKMAIFSVWNAVGAEGPGVLPFANEGSGWSARIPYQWVAARPYRLRVWTPAAGWWVAAVLDTVTGEEAEIGRIRVPEEWDGLGTWSVMWTEYYGGPLSRCADMAYSRVVFETPTADGGVGPADSRSHIGAGTCENSRIETLAVGVRHEMGLVDTGPVDMGPVGEI